MNAFSAGFAAVAEYRRHEVAVIDALHDRSWSYAELRGAVDRCVATLAARIGPAERAVVSIVPNSLDQLVVFLACMSGGFSFAPLSSHTTQRELGRLIELVGEPLVIAPESASGEVESLVPPDSIRVPLDGSLEWLDDGKSGEVGGRARLLIPTSGSTGEPKLIVLDGNRLWESARAFVGYQHFVGAQSRFLNNLPMSYLGGLFNLAVVPLSAGASIVIVEAFSGKSFLTFWQDVERFEVDTLWLAPAMVRGFLELAERTKRPERLREHGRPLTAFLGMAPIDLKSKLAFESTFQIPLIENYGLSETTFLTSEKLAGGLPREEGSVGEILPWVHVRIRPLEDGSSGEVEVETPFVFEGYLGARGQVRRPTTDDGWFATGDLGRITASGQLVIEGRLREVVKKGGFLISLREIELLAEECPEVRAAAAVGVPHRLYGEDYVVFVELEPGVEISQAVGDVRRTLVDGLPRHKWPGDVRVVDELPRTSVGKVRKGQLTDDFLQSAPG